jgi:2-keto-4-pentenoate hydratase/2-oxohepta-3-ene-1,7-dioic acid hydratase in catechol pathway
MKVLRFLSQDQVYAGVLIAGGVQAFPSNDLLGMIQSGEWPASAGPVLPLAEVTPILPYDVPPKIWCIGLNYHSHAVDINAVQPEEPGSFMKPASCMFPPAGEIVLPPPAVSSDVDAEGELAVVIGRRVKGLASLEEAHAAIFGYTTTLDLTALDVLAKNPRYLTRAKSMDTFFSFGPVIVTKDEIAEVNDLEVITEHNGAVWSRDFVRNMKHRPLELVRFHSQAMTLYPGDIISTGCPTGARIKSGDTVRARIDGVGTLGATVR